MKGWISRLSFPRHSPEHLFPGAPTAILGPYFFSVFSASSLKTGS